MEDQNSSSLEGGDSEQLATTLEKATADATNLNTPSRFQLLKSRGLLTKLLIVGLLVLMLSGVGVTIALTHKPAKSSTTITINTQSLDNGTLNKLTAQSPQGETAQTQLTISPSTLFKSDVTVQNDLTVKGSSNLLGPVATGNNLAVGGGLTVGRNAGIGGSLSVSGIITAGSLNVGVINLSTLTLSGNFSWGGHLISTGTAVTVSPGVAIGDGTTTITGNDSVGSVVINVGHNGLLNSGEMAIIHFHTSYPGTPIVQLTPANQDAAGASYYVVAAPGFFSVRTIAPLVAGASYVFNFLVAQ